MKKQNVILLSAIAGLTLALPFTAQAAEYQSNGQITFEPNTDITKPVDPLAPNPADPITPTDPTNPNGPNPGTAGPLSIDFASSLYFGRQKITSKTEIYHAETQKYTNNAGTASEGPNFVQVSDNRGTEAGWTLTVKQNGQFKSSTNKELTAAEIRLNNGTITSPSASAKPSSFQSAITLDPTGAESLVMSAKQGEGAGTYLMGWGDSIAAAAESIELEIPGSTTKYAVQYATTFTWKLSDTPANTPETTPEATPNP